MIQDDLQKLSTKTVDLRKFGLMVGGAFFLLGGWLLLRHKVAAPYFLAVGLLLGVSGLVAPRALKIVYIAWMSLALTMGLFISTLILTLFYFLVVTPLGLTGRLFGKDFLSEKLDLNAQSYWFRRDSSKSQTAADYERQY